MRGTLTGLWGMKQFSDLCAGAVRPADYPESVGRAVGLLDALQDAGLDVIEYVGWETRGSPTFNPRGVVVHHTGPWSTVEGMVQLCIHGRKDLPGPLCHVVLDPAGTCHVIAAGRANHAGAGGWQGLTGNTRVLGIEAVNSGSEPWPGEQLAAFVLAAAALCRLAGADADMVCSHKEWAPRRKVDPAGIDMDWFRGRVASWLERWSGPTEPLPQPTPAPVFEEVDVVRFQQEFVEIAELDGDGRGWIDLPVSIESCFDVVAQGSSPPEEGYWSPVVVTVQPRGGITRVTLAGTPEQRTGLFYKRALE